MKHSLNFATLLHFAPHSSHPLLSRRNSAASPGGRPMASRSATWTAPSFPATTSTASPMANGSSTLKFQPTVADWSLQRAGRHQFKRTAGIIEEAAKSNAKAGSDARKIADLYNSYMNEQAIEAKGLTRSNRSSTPSATIKDKRELARALGESLRADVDPLEQHQLPYCEPLRTLGRSRLS